MVLLMKVIMSDSSLQVFAEWNKGELDSFLIEITANILAFKDTDGELSIPAAMPQPLC